MVSFRELCCCVRQLHPDLQHRVKPETLRKYQVAMQNFVSYAQLRGNLLLETPGDLDQLFMEYRTENDLPKAQHILLLAALEFFMPDLKGKLVLAREAIKGRATVETVHHTRPLPTNVAFLFSAHLASEGRARMGAAILVQLASGLRPSELLNIRRRHVYVPGKKDEQITIALGVEVSTKIKREQFVVVNSHENPVAHRLLQLLCEFLQDDEFLFDFSYHTYNKAFSECEQSFGVDLGLTAHSARAGFATNGVINQIDPKLIQRRGRWISEASFATYIDVVGSLHAQTQVAAASLDRQASWVERHIWEYLRPDTLYVHAQSGRLHASKTGYASKGKQTTATSSSCRTHSKSTFQVAREHVAAVESTNDQSSPQFTRKGGANSDTVQPSRCSKGRGRGVLVKRR